MEEKRSYPKLLAGALKLSRVIREDKNSFYDVCVYLENNSKKILIKIVKAADDSNKLLNECLLFKELSSALLQAFITSQK